MQSVIYIQIAIGILKVVYPHFPIFLPPGYMSKTELERVRSKDLSY